MQELSLLGRIAIMTMQSYIAVFLIISTVLISQVGNKNQIQSKYQQKHQKVLFLLLSLAIIFLGNLALLSQIVASLPPLK